MNIASLPSLSVFVADIVVGPPPPPNVVPKALAGSGVASLCFWALAAVAALMLWRMRRRRAILEERTAPTPAAPRAE